MDVSAKAKENMQKAAIESGVTMDYLIRHFGQHRMTQVQAAVENNIRKTTADLVLKWDVFQDACRFAQVEPTRRQALKFIRHEGAAWNAAVKVARANL